MNLLFSLLLLIGITSTSSSCPACCIWNVTTTQPSIKQTPTGNGCGCTVTLRELIELESNTSTLENDNGCLRKELILNSGVHHLYGNDSTYELKLEFRNLSRVVIRGYTYATIKCTNQSLSFLFKNISTIQIQNTYIDDCGDLKRFKRKSIRNMIIVIIKEALFSMEIVNSKLTNAGMSVHAFTNNNDTKVTIKVERTVVENLASYSHSTDAVLHLKNHEVLSPSSQIIATVLLKNVTAKYNNRPFLEASEFDETLILLNGDNIFSHNIGTIVKVTERLYYTKDDRSFYDISGYHDTLVLITGKNLFSNNKGTVIKLENLWNNLTFSRAEVSFINNTQSSDYTIIDIPVYFSGGAIQFRASKLSFINNNGGILARYSRITFSECTSVQFINNNEEAAGVGNTHQRSGHTIAHPIHAEAGVLSFEHTSVVFNNNQGGIVTEEYTKITFRDNVTIQFINNNRLQNGGALSLASSDSIIVFNASSLRITLSFTNNTADKGGAIYMKDSHGITPVFDFQCDPTLVDMTFSNNSALYGGNHIYGGWVDWTIDTESGNISYNSAINKSLNIKTKTKSDIASCPVRICLCHNGHPNCTITNHTIEVHGYSLSLSLVAVGQRYTPVAAYITASLESDNSDSNEEQWLHLWPRTESLQAACTTINYKFYSIKEIIHYKPELETCYNINEDFDEVSDRHSKLFKHLSIEVKSTPCPLGFILHRIERRCICDQLFGLTCDEANIKIIRKEQEWIGVTNEHIKPGEAIGVLTYSPCPFDYCRTDNHSLSIHLEDQDVVCAFNRSGILCGGCRANFSRVLGSSKCKECSNNIPIIIVIFLGQVLFGLMVVIALILLDLTVATGTINGLTFYANIIQAQHATFFTQGTAYSFLSFFIARLNLDEGIELCLYDGLDEYAITWLKIPLPLYMWLFAGILIVLSHCSSRFSKLIGKNIVQVLATLFLISYTRLLQLIINVFTYTSLTYPDGYRKKVWYVDGNVEYFKGKHIPLFFVTVLFLSVSLPYTVILLTIQLLYKISHYRLMFWVQRLKPFFDAYTGPYKAPHRYWTGLLLVVRGILLALFSMFQSTNSLFNLLFIIVVIFVLVGWFSLAKGVYESFLNNFLEITFLCNLGITSAVVLVDRQHTKVAIYISTGTAFITFVCIILYHVVKQLLLTKLGSKVKGRLTSTCLSKGKDGDIVNQNLTESNLSLSGGQVHNTVTSTTVELKEPLLEAEGNL